MSRSDLICWFCKLRCTSNNFSCDRCRKCYHNDCHLTGKARGARNVDTQLIDIYPIIHGPVPPEYLCPLCKLLAYANEIVFDKRFLHSMNRAMVHAVKILMKADVNSIFLNPVTLEDYKTHVLEPKSLSEILNDAKAEKYQSVAAFETDIRLIYHNSNVYNGIAEKVPITAEARKIMMIGVEECAKIRYCSECYWHNIEYDNLKLKSDFLKPCERPHGVCWAKNDDGDMSLAKIVGYHIDKRVNKMVDVCFFQRTGDARVQRTVRMDDCFIFCDINAFDQFCKNDEEPMKIAVSTRVKEDVQRYFENVKKMNKVDAPRITKRQENKRPEYLDEKHLYLTESVTEWDFTNEFTDKDDRKNRLNRATEFTQFFIDPKIPKEPEKITHHRTSEGGSSKAEKSERSDRSDSRSQPPKADKRPKTRDSSPTHASSSSKAPQPTAPKVQRVSVTDSNHSSAANTSKVLTKGKLPKDFQNTHNSMLKKREIYSNRVDAFDKKRKSFNANDGRYTAEEDCVKNEDVEHDDGEKRKKKKPEEDVIINMKEEILTDVSDMDVNKEKIKEILAKYPEAECSTSINNWRKVILTLADTSLNGARSMLKEVLHKEKIPGLKAKCEFYEGIRELEAPDRRDICDNCFQAANYFHPVGDKYHTFCEPKCADEFTKKQNDD